MNAYSVSSQKCQNGPFSASAPLNPYGDANCLSKDSDFLFALQFNGLVSSTLHTSLESRDGSFELDESFCCF